MGVSQYGTSHSPRGSGYTANNVHKSSKMAQRKVIFHEEHFSRFLQAQSEAVRRKILQVIVWIETIDRLPVSIMKSIESVKGLYEIRITFASNIYRIFCCFDQGNLVVLFNAFQKKTQKTPQSEIEKAARLMKEYFKAKALPQ